MPLTDSQLIEKIELLTGARSRESRAKAAVRIEDLVSLAATPQRLQAGVAAGATPTKAEFDALRADVEKLRLICYGLMEALRDRQVK